LFDDGVGTLYYARDFYTALFQSACLGFIFNIFISFFGRILFEDAFRIMYGLPEGIAALPPMPNDGDYWSTLHSWVMPTPSFLKFIMFSR
jgi:hypothetical protein